MTVRYNDIKASVRPQATSLQTIQEKSEMSISQMKNILETVKENIMLKVYSPPRVWLSLVPVSSWHYQKQIIAFRVFKEQKKYWRQSK